jgi:hypothetical protein
VLGNGLDKSADLLEIKLGLASLKAFVAVLTELGLLRARPRHRLRQNIRAPQIDEAGPAEGSHQ